MDFGENKLYLRVSDEENDMVRTISGHMAIGLGKEVDKHSDEVVQAVMMMKKQKYYSMKKLKRFIEFLGIQGRIKFPAFWQMLVIWMAQFPKF